MKKVLLTTPDYPPKLGGLSTFCTNIEKVLRELEVSYELQVWNNFKKISPPDQSFDYVIHINFIPGAFLNFPSARQINFIHGSEILFTSPNIFKKFIKKIVKGKLLRYLESSLYNVFISEFTFNKTRKQGLVADYSRDLIVHNGIEISSHASFVKKNLSDETLKLVCMVRDVPHKNVDGCLELAYHLATITNKKIELALTADRKSSHPLVKINNIAGISDEEKMAYLKNAHFNILLSLDHSQKGFYEGFGLTVLEAGQFGTPSIVASSGGLPESVHHEKTGWVLSDCDHNTLFQLWNDSIVPRYLKVSENCFRHTTSSHSLDIYKRIFRELL